MANEKIETLVLETLSHFEEMSIEKLLIDMPIERIKEVGEFTKEDLEATLKDLTKKKKIKVARVKDNKEVFYLKLFPKKSLWRRIKEKILK